MTVGSTAVMSIGSTATVVIDRGRAPEGSTHVRLEEFDGPLGLLLALIEGRRLDVLTVPLAALADAYLDALASLPGERIGNLSAFVAIASQLRISRRKRRTRRPSSGRAWSCTALIATRGCRSRRMPLPRWGCSVASRRQPRPRDSQVPVRPISSRCP